MQRQGAEQALKAARDDLEVRVAERTSELKQANADLQGQVTERKRAEEALKLAKQQAELASRTKSEFLANMSHELRTPLNAIIGFSEMISSEMLGAIENRKYLEYASDIAGSGQHLLDLINDILDLSKIEAGKLELDEVEADIATIIGSCLTLVTQRAREAGVVLDAQIPEDVPAIRGDERRLKQIVINLLSNAIKFTPTGGRVSVAAAIDGSGDLTLSVSDTGVGIAPEDLPKVMEVFGQVGDVLSREHQGSGLGLPLSRALAELHNGTLDIESALGTGTTVTLRLPASRTVSMEASVA
jgi:two-component system cell cycle sensor histidine kinase PleC